MDPRHPHYHVTHAKLSIHTTHAKTLWTHATHATHVIFLTHAKILQTHPTDTTDAKV